MHELWNVHVGPAVVQIMHKCRSKLGCVSFFYWGRECVRGLPKDGLNRSSPAFWNFSITGGGGLLHARGQDSVWRILSVRIEPCSNWFIFLNWEKVWSWNLQIHKYYIQNLNYLFSAHSQIIWGYSSSSNWTVESSSACRLLKRYIFR